MPLGSGFKKLASVATGGGGGAGLFSLGGSLLGSFASSKFGRSDFDHRISRLRSLGLTPQEIAGGGGAGSSGALGSYQTLGNAAPQAVQAQQQQQRMRLEKYKADLAARTQVTTAGIGAQAARDQADLANRRYADSGRQQGIAGVDKTRTETKLLGVKTDRERQLVAFERWSNTREWQQLKMAAGMGVGNMVATASMLQMAKAEGIDIFSGQATVEQMGRVVRRMLALDSHVYREVVGAAELGRETGEAVNKAVVKPVAKSEKTADFAVSVIRGAKAALDSMSRGVAAPPAALKSLGQVLKHVMRGVGGKSPTDGSPSR